MELKLPMQVGIKPDGPELMIQTLIKNGVPIRFTLTVEQAAELAHKLNAQVETARQALRNRKGGRA
jgi:hypothetical protein